jgi:uncharacterized protein (TIGR03000 family)
MVTLVLALVMAQPPIPGQDGLDTASKIKGLRELVVRFRKERDRLKVELADAEVRYQGALRLLEEAEAEERRSRTPPVEVKKNPVVEEPLPEEVKPAEAAPPPPAKSVEKDNRCLITMLVNEDAVVSVWGTKLKSTGTRRTLRSPPLDPARDHYYTFTVTDRLGTRDYTLYVRPGKEVTLDARKGRP